MPRGSKRSSPPAFRRATYVERKVRFGQNGAEQASPAPEDARGGAYLRPASAKWPGGERLAGHIGRIFDMAPHVGLGLRRVVDLVRVGRAGRPHR